MSLASVSRAARRQLIREDTELRKRIVAEYRVAWRRIEARLEEIQRKLAESPSPRPGLIAERWKLLELQSQIIAEVRGFSKLAALGVTEFQADLVHQAQSAAVLQLEEAFPNAPAEFSFAPRVPTVQIAEMGRMLMDSEPLGALIAQAAPHAAAEVKQALVAGVALGLNPRQVAKRMRAAGAMPLRRALLIARTEMLRVYRTTVLDVYRANKEVVTGWYWSSALDRRTCPVCWGMHGSEHKLVEPFESHPACRCTPVPITKTWKQLGFPDVPETKAKFERGEEVLRRLPVSEQRAILGPGRLSLFEAGVPLSEMVARTSHPVWGGGRRLRTLKELQSRTGPQMVQPSTAIKPPRDYADEPLFSSMEESIQRIFEVQNMLAPGEFPAERVAEQAPLAFQNFKQAVEALDKVLRIPDGLPVTLDPYPGGLSAPFGSLDLGSQFFGAALKYNVTRPSKSQSITILHEFGHFLDARRLITSKGHEFASELGETGDVMAAIQRSDAFQKLRAAPRRHEGDRLHFEYLESPRECFARAFAQYVAVRSGSTDLEVQLLAAKRREWTASFSQWESSDFEPIAEAFDDLFRSKGWLK